MLKRVNKITSLLIVAASITSMVPATAAIKLTNLNGFINNAIAFNGGYVYSGYKDSNAAGVYYYKYKEKDKFLEDSELYDLKGQYNNNYDTVYDALENDDYLLDLSSAEIDKDQNPEDNMTSAMKKLEKVLKKTDRYGKDISITSNYDDTSYISSGLNSSDLVKLNGTKFGSTWYQYGVATTSSVATANLVNDKLYGYTDSTGKYIDTSNVANIYAYSNQENKAVKIKEFNSVPDDYDKVTCLQAKLTAQPTVIAEDKDYIYQKVNVDLYDYSDHAIKQDGKTTVTLDFSNPQMNRTASYLPSNEVYSFPYATIVSDDVIKKFTNNSTHPFNGTTFTYTTDSTATDGGGTIYFRDRAELIQKIHSTNAMIIGTNVKEDNSVNSKTNKYVFYDKLFVNTPVTYAGGTSTDKTENPFYDSVDRKMYGNITNVQDSKWTVVQGAILDVWGGNSTMRMLGSNLGSFGLSSDLIAVANVNASTVNVIEALDKDKFSNKTEQFKVGEVEFYYNPLAESTDTNLYKDAIDLQTKVNAYFTAIKDDSSKMNADIGIDGATYSSGAFTFESSKIEDGTALLDDLKSKFGDIAVIDSDFENLKTDIFPTKHTYIQKISKAQGEEVDGAYVPKTVESYEITNAYDSNDANEAYNLLTTTTPTYTAVNGNLQTIQNTATSSAGILKVTTLKLKKDRVVFKENPGTNDDDTNTFDITQQVQVYLVEKDDDKEDDIDLTNIKAVDTDVDGNVWAVNGGKIYKYDEGKFKQLYSCSSAYDNLNVYDKNNLVAWSNGTNASYTSVIDGEKQTIETATKLTGKVIDTDPLTTTTTASATVTADLDTTHTPGWNQTSDGIWNFYDETGTKVASKWCYVDGNWYFLKADGSMAAGWLQNLGKWYYLGADGAMKSGWVNVNNNWYLLNTLGDMATGWINDEGKWYYLSESGEMLYNTTVNGYNLGASGEIVSSTWIN